MIRKLLATTALASIIATGAFAQTSSTAPATSTTPATEPTAMAPAAASSNVAGSSQYLTKLGPDQYLASELTGEDLYASTAADSQTAGEIQNFLVGKDGKVLAAIVDTGSFLDQSKVVAVPFEKIQWTAGDEPGEARAVLTATREELTAAPAFIAETAQQAAAGGAMTPGTGTAATTDTQATASSPSVAVPAQPVVTAANGGYLATVGNDQYLSKTIIGQSVRSGTSEDAQKIGDVNDLVIAKGGQIAAAIVGVGGFLGIGEKDVGVPFAELSLSRDGDNALRAVMAATKEQLTSAPTFDEDGDDAVAANGTAQSISGSAASTGAAAGAAIGSAADATRTAAGNAMTATGNALDSAGTKVSNATESAGAAMTGAANSVADTTTTASTGNAAERAQMTPVTGPELTAEKVVGTTVYGPNDQNIGKVGDIAMTATGQVDAVILDVGGFLGIGSKPVAVAMDNLKFMRDSGGSMYLYTDFTQDQLKNAPEYNRESYAQNRDTMRVQPGAALAPATTGTTGATTTQ